MSRLHDPSSIEAKLSETLTAKAWSSLDVVFLPSKQTLPTASPMDDLLFACTIVILSSPGSESPCKKSRLPSQLSTSDHVALSSKSEGLES